MAILEQILQRQDGSEVRLLAQAYFGRGLHCSIGVDVFHRASPGNAWQLTSDRPHPDWLAMSVDEYVKRGRCEKFQVASIGEILKASNTLRASLCM